MENRYPTTAWDPIEWGMSFQLSFDDIPLSAIKILLDVLP